MTPQTCGNFPRKMAGAGIHSIAKSSALILRLDTTEITPWQTTFICTADYQLLLSDLIQTMRKVQDCDNPLSNTGTVKTPHHMVGLAIQAHN
jgi:hypothetical protein